MRKWFRIENKGNDSNEIFLYGIIGQDFWGDGVDAEELVQDISKMDVKNIDLRINSPGGNVFDGLAIYNTLMSHKATVNVKVDGIAASIASVIAMSGDTIEMPENAMMMIHDPSGMAIGTSKDMRALADDLDKVKTGLVSAYRDKSNMDENVLAQMMDVETLLTAKEAVGFGLADKITEKINIQACADMRMFNRMFKTPIPSIFCTPENIVAPIENVVEPIVTDEQPNKTGLKLTLLRREFESKRL